MTYLYTAFRLPMARYISAIFSTGVRGWIACVGPMISPPSA